MKSFASWMLIMIVGLFWIFRVVVLFTSSMGMEFIVQPISEETEMLLLFITIICIVLIAKRKMAGAIIYLLTYWVYFGMDAIQRVISMINGNTGLQTTVATVSSLIGILLPLFVLIDILLDKGRKTSGGNKQTDWFYKNKQFDRELDERADKNHYKF